VKAAVYTALKTIEFRDRPMPKAGPGEVVVKIKYCGICRTDVDIYFEGILPPGIVLGHENVGTVAEVNAGRKRHPPLLDTISQIVSTWLDVP
jgi:threonine dehydrogenase-like Zn-dependent dehydrogenase